MSEVSEADLKIIFDKVEEFVNEQKIDFTIELQKKLFLIYFYEDMKKAIYTFQHFNSELYVVIDQILKRLKADDDVPVDEIISTTVELDHDKKLLHYVLLDFSYIIYTKAMFELQNIGQHHQTQSTQ